MKNLLKFTLIGLFWILVWYILALIIDLPLIFPSPLSVIIRLGELLTKWGFYKIALLSFVRIIIGIFIAVCGGCFMAFICSYQADDAWADGERGGGADNKGLLTLKNQRICGEIQR